MGARTLEEMREDYTALRAAWRTAIKAEEREIDSGGNRRRVVRRSDALYKQMKELESEINLEDQGGITGVGVTLL